MVWTFDSAIFQATLLLFCYFSFASASSGTAEFVDVLGVVDWLRLAESCDLTNGAEVPCRHSSQSAQQAVETPQERNVTDGNQGQRVLRRTREPAGHRHVRGDPALAGQNSMRARASLISHQLAVYQQPSLAKVYATGHGDMLGNILSNICF